MDANELAIKVRKIIDRLASSKIGSFVDASLTPPEPFRGKGKIKLIVLGQDPTVQKPEHRKNIKVTLLLDQPGRLKTYLGDICNGLDTDVDENIYAKKIPNSFRRRQTIGFHCSKRKSRNLKMCLSCLWVSLS